MHIHIGLIEVLKIGVAMGIVNIVMRLIALHLRSSRIGQALSFAY